MAIRSFKHKGMEQFFMTGSKAGIQASQAKKLNLMLGWLDVAEKPDDMNLPGLFFHRLKGRAAHRYALSVNGNWRLTFEFEGTDAVLIDYEDYH